MGRCTEGGRRPTGERRRLKFFPQGVHSDASAGKLSWSESSLARVANDQTQPRERTMTIDRMTLKALVEKGSDDDLLSEMMAYVANCMMDMEVGGYWRVQRHWQTADGAPLVSIKAEQGLLSFRKGIGGEVEVQAPDAALPELGLLIAPGWYLVVCAMDSEGEGG
jgi:hypothetical protein